MFRRVQRCSAAYHCCNAWLFGLTKKAWERYSLKLIVSIDRWLTVQEAMARQWIAPLMHDASPGPRLSEYVFLASTHNQMQQKENKMLERMCKSRDQAHACVPDAHRGAMTNWDAAAGPSRDRNGRSQMRGDADTYGSRCAPSRDDLTNGNDEKTRPSQAARILSNAVLWSRRMAAPWYHRYRVCLSVWFGREKFCHRGTASFPKRTRLGICY